MEDWVVSLPKPPSSPGVSSCKGANRPCAHAFRRVARASAVSNAARAGAPSYARCSSLSSCNPQAGGAASSLVARRWVAFETKETPEYRRIRGRGAPAQRGRNVDNSFLRGQLVHLLGARASLSPCSSELASSWRRRRTTSRHSFAPTPRASLIRARACTCRLWPR